MRAREAHAALCVVADRVGGKHVTQWSAVFVSYTDRLVHLADEHYTAQIVEGHPLMAFTRCGHVVTWDGIHASGGRYVTGDVPLTCVRCVGGARDGNGRRQAMKGELFAQMYGRSAGNIGSLAAVDAQATLRLFEQWRPLGQRALGPVFRRCAQLSQVLYSKATEVDRA